LDRRVDEHVGFELRRDARRLKNAHAFVVGIDGAGVAVELRLALERQHAQAPEPEQMRERQTRRAKPDDHNLILILD